MADIRINSLSTTASASSSDDFLAIDGTTNGTRKLSAYSPTFGGNLTVSGYADLGSGGIGTPAAGHIQVGGSGSYGAAIIGRGSAYDFGLFNKNGDDVIHVATGTTNVAISGNLTVSGGTISSGAGNTLLLQQANYGGGLSANASGQVVVAAYNSQPLRLQTQGADVLYLTSGGNALIGTTTDAGGKLQIATGASNTLLIGNDATYTGYNQISLNGTRTNSGVLGMIGGGAGDSQLYLLAPTGGALVFQIAAATVFSVNSTGDATLGGKITTSAPTGGAGAWELGVANTVSPTAPNRTITIEIGGTVYYLHAKTTND